MPLQVRSDLEPEAFRAAVRPFLLRDEAAHALHLSILDGIESGRWTEADRLVVTRDGEVVGVALRTPPHDPVLSEPAPGEEARFPRAVADGFLRDGVALRGVQAPGPMAEAFAAHWCEATGAETYVLRRMRLHRLDAVEAVPKSSGSLRPAVADDRELLIAWSIAFQEEVAAEDASASDAAHTKQEPSRIAASVDRMLAAEEFWLWQAEDGPVSMAAAIGPTPNAIRISYVYTPPGQRGHGYATSLVADLSRAQLAAGRRFCTLYTDLANPTSNAIYHRIGYRGIGDRVHLRFVSTTP